MENVTGGPAIPPRQADRIEEWSTQLRGLSLPPAEALGHIVHEHQSLGDEESSDIVDNYATLVAMAECQPRQVAQPEMQAAAQNLLRLQTVWIPWQGPVRGCWDPDADASGLLARWESSAEHLLQSLHRKYRLFPELPRTMLVDGFVEADLIEPLAEIQRGRMVYLTKVLTDIEGLQELDIGLNSSFVEGSLSEAIGGWRESQRPLQDLKLLSIRPTEDFIENSRVPNTNRAGNLLKLPSLETFTTSRMAIGRSLDGSSLLSGQLTEINFWQMPICFLRCGHMDPLIRILRENTNLEILSLTWAGMAVYGHTVNDLPHIEHAPRDTINFARIGQSLRERNRRLEKLTIDTRHVDVVLENWEPHVCAAVRERAQDKRRGLKARSLLGSLTALTSLRSLALDPNLLIRRDARCGHGRRLRDMLPQGLQELILYMDDAALGKFETLRDPTTFGDFFGLDMQRFHDALPLLTGDLSVLEMGYLRWIEGKSLGSQAWQRICRRATIAEEILHLMKSPSSEIMRILIDDGLPFLAHSRLPKGWAHELVEQGNKVNRRGPPLASLGYDHCCDVSDAVVAHELRSQHQYTSRFYRLPPGDPGHRTSQTCHCHDMEFPVPSVDDYYAYEFHTDGQLAYFLARSPSVSAQLAAMIWLVNTRQSAACTAYMPRYRLSTIASDDHICTMRVVNGEIKDACLCPRSIRVLAAL